MSPQHQQSNKCNKFQVSSGAWSLSRGYRLRIQQEIDVFGPKYLKKLAAQQDDELSLATIRAINEGIPATLVRDDETFGDPEEEGSDSDDQDEMTLATVKASCSKRQDSDDQDEMTLATVKANCKRKDAGSYMSENGENQPKGTKKKRCEMDSPV